MDHGVDKIEPMENLAKTVGRTRKNFSRIQSTLAIPNLIAVYLLLPELRADLAAYRAFAGS